MKKLITTLTIALVAIIGARAADVSEVWSALSSDGNMISAPVDSAIAAKQGFTDLSVALNPMPDEGTFARVKEALLTVPANQKLTEATKEGTTVAVYAAPADNAATAYRVLYVITKPDGDVNTLILLYGTVTRDNMVNALTNLNIEEIIGA